jgi:hypothetical protein
MGVNILERNEAKAMNSDDVKIYAFYNNKGGVGKTTLCSNAVAL